MKEVILSKTILKSKLYNELEVALSSSTMSQRMAWANLIIEHDIEIEYLSNLLRGERKTAMRFLWLISDIGTLSPNKLFRELPFLLALSDQIEENKFVQSFASYWLISGVPKENESRAIDLLFEWVLSPKTNMTTKSRSLKVLYTLALKHPELKNELTLCLNDQMYKHSKDFEKKARKMIVNLENQI